MARCSIFLIEVPPISTTASGFQEYRLIAHYLKQKVIFMQMYVCEVSENKVLCHPSSVDSLSTSAGTEDHVSMGGWAARKALQVVKNVEYGKNFSEIPLLSKSKIFDMI